ncbi:MAG TPA: RNA-binding protein [bacterium]
MGKRLYVGSLPFETTDGELQELFSTCGQVENAKVITDRETGRSKGFGFVEMATDAEALAAIQKMNGAAVGSRQIVVNEAKPKEDRPRGGGGNSGFKPRGNFGGNSRDGGGGGGYGGGGGTGGGGYGGDGGGNRKDFNRGGGTGKRRPSGDGSQNRWS